MAEAARGGSDGEDDEAVEDDGHKEDLDVEEWETPRGDARDASAAR